MKCFFCGLDSVTGGQCEACGAKADTREVYWFAEVNRESQAQCFACKDVNWPRWVGTDGRLTNEPNSAKKFHCRADCLDFCSTSTARHWHLHPTEHVFVGDRT